MALTHPSALPTRHLAWGFGILFAALLLGGAAISWMSWRTHQANWERQLSADAESRAAAADRLLEQTEGALKLLGLHLFNDGILKDSEGIRAVVERFQRAYPDVGPVDVFGHDGAALVATGGAFALSQGERRRLLQAALADPVQHLYLGQPFEDAAGMQRFPLVFSVRDRSGELRCLLSLNLPTAALSVSPIAASHPASHAAGWLHDSSSLAASSASERLATAEAALGDALHAYLQRNAHPAAGLVRLETPPQAQTQVFAFQRLSGYPVSAFVAVPAEVVSATWFAQARFGLLLALLGLAVGLLVFAIVRKNQLAWEISRNSSDRKDRLAAHALEHAMEGIFIVDAKRRIVSVNRGFCDITGYAAADVERALPSMLASPFHDEDFYRLLWQQMHAEGCWQGEIWDQRKNGQKYPLHLSLSAVASNGKKATHYVGAFKDVSQYKDYESCLEFLANHDPLTNLPNRMLMQNRLQEAVDRAAQSAKSLAVMFIDLDRFKIINDSLGHVIGDRVLQTVAERLQAAVRPTDTVARLGGDEFTVVLEDSAGAEQVAGIAQGLLDALLQPMQIDSHELYVSASIGISCYPGDGADIQTLVRHADTAMYRAKEEGRDKYKFFAPEMNARAQEFMIMAHSLHGAWERNELVLEYQPRVELATGMLVGVEALIRWEHPKLGRVSPEKFIPLAEDTGLIVEIGEWAMRAACRQGREWLDAGYSIQVAVNLSLRQFRNKDLVPTILAIVADTGFRRELLEVEITETLMMHDPQSVMATLNAFHEHGIRIALDDFGTGYSSLNYLKQFPIDTVKIDKSFVRDVPADADSITLIKAIIAMAKNLRLSLVAEGVETATQRDLLRDQGCDEAQGYYFSRPVPAAQMMPLLRASGRTAPAMIENVH